MHCSWVHYVHSVRVSFNFTFNLFRVILYCGWIHRWIYSKFLAVKNLKKRFLAVK
uniref:Uncharacterized protein n=1 Tax=Arundo donax TaxID=35708 RepID=A0A0A9BFH3_ARUDO